MKVRAHVLVSGVVQGVFFRANTRDSAVSLGVNGWVRNTPDGKVEAVFEGKKEVVKEVIDFCRRGPPGASVDGVEVVWEEKTEGLRSFEIRY